MGSRRENLDNPHQLRIGITLIPVPRRSLMMNRIVLRIAGTMRILLIPAEYWDDKNGTDTETLCGSEVDTWIGFGIVRYLGSTRLQAGPGESVCGTEGQAEARGKFSSGGAADHGIATRKRQRSSSCGSRRGGPSNEFIQH
jgi:hypothetical protein